jgi:hypothetical protein
MARFSGGLWGRATGGGPLARAPLYECLTPNSVMTVDIRPGFSAIQPLSLPPLVFVQEYGAEFGELFGWIVERLQDDCALVDREGEDLDVVPLRLLEPVGEIGGAGCSEEFNESVYDGWRYRYTGEHYRGEAR